MTQHSDPLPIGIVPLVGIRSYFNSIHINIFIFRATTPIITRCIPRVCWSHNLTICIVIAFFSFWYSRPNPIVFIPYQSCTKSSQFAIPIFICGYITHIIHPSFSGDKVIGIRLDHIPRSIVFLGFALNTCPFIGSGSPFHRDIFQYVLFVTYGGMSQFSGRGVSRKPCRSIPSSWYG